MGVGGISVEDDKDCCILVSSGIDEEKDEEKEGVEGVKGAEGVEGAEPPQIDEQPVALATI